MADRIVQRISLEGAEDVQAKLKKTGEVGAKALAATNRTIEDSNSGLGKYGNVFAGLNGKTEESRESIERVKKLVETIKPAAEKAGLELGGIGEFGKIGRGGVIALAGAVGTTLVAALEKAGDTARDQAQRLGSFTGTAQDGVESYNALKKTAGELEIPNSGLAAPFEQLVRANQRSDAGLNGDDQQAVLKTLFEGANADRVPLDKSQEGITTLLGGLREQGQLTPEASKAAQEIFPTLMKRLSEDLTKSFPDQVAPFTTPQVLKSLQSIGPQIGKDLEATKNAFPPSIEDSLNKLKSSAGSLGDALNGTTVVSTALDGAAKFVDAVAGGIKKVKESVAGLPAGATTVPLEQADRIRDQRGFGPVQGPQQYPPRPPSTLAPEETPVGIRFLQYIFGIKGQTYQAPGEQPYEGAPGATPKWEEVGSAADKLGENLAGAADKAKSAEQIFDDFNKKGAEQLGVIGSKLSTEQARIDYEHKPEETDIQIGRDQLAVENADIAKQSAQIGVQDAAKGKEAANLAPEQAENASRDAESRYTKALKNLRNLEGYDTSAIQDNPLRDARNELRDADTARKVADVNRRYAYLEPQKAELAQKKAQTDVTSSDYLERDASLKLTKDQQGRQLSSDVAGLRYAQAQLDEQQKIAKSGDVSVSLLDKILGALSGRKSDKSEDRSPGEQTGKSGERRSIDRRSRFGDAGDAAGPASSTSASESPISGSSGTNVPVKESYIGENALKKIEDASGVASINSRTTQSEIDDKLKRSAQIRENDLDKGQPALDPAKVQSAIDKFRQIRTGGMDALIKSDPEAAATLSALSDRSDGSVKGQAPQTAEQQRRTFENQRQIGEFEGQSAYNFSNIDNYAEKLDSDRAKQHGIVPHPSGGKADLSERLYPGGPLRYRYNPDASYQPAETGHYEYGDGSGKPLFNDRPYNPKKEGRDGFVPDPNKDQPYPRLRDKPFFSDRAYSPLEDTFDTKGRQSATENHNPIYHYGQPQPLSYPQYNKDLQDSFPQTVPLPQPRPPEADQIQGPVPLPQPRPPEAGPGQQSSLPSPQDVASLGDAFRTLIEGISAELSSAKQQTVATTEAVPDSGVAAPSDDGSGGAVSKTTQSLDDLTEAFSEAANAIRGDAAKTDEPTHAATGGLITGPGSTTSDSIPAMLSNKEFVVNAAAAQKHSGLLHAINSGKEIGFKHFAVGGPVGFMGDIGLPHVSSGPIAHTGGGPDHLGTVDLRTNHGEFKMMASQDVARQMARAAGDAALTQTGPRPSWVRGR